jgi:hypothetical protein
VRKRLLKHPINSSTLTLEYPELILPRFIADEMNNMCTLISKGHPCYCRASLNRETFST